MSTLNPPAFTAQENETIDAEYLALRQDYLNSNHRQKTEIIDRAFALARKAHGVVRRRSGEPYILHPIAVARIVCREMGLGSTSIACALLHDVVEDTDYTTEDLREMFGDKVAQIVEGLTKISGEKFDNSTSSQAENFRKLLITMADDARVILIKIADRLHNMRTLSSMLPAKQFKIAGETQYIYAPLANRFGLFSIKSELEDLSFRYEYPEQYREVARLVELSEEGRQNYFLRFAEPIKKALESHGLKYEMKARVKSNFSIWRKMETKGIPFEEVYDLFAVRIIFDTEDGYPERNRCWDIYTAITEIYRPHPDRLRDWISNPKTNGYQALHLTVMGPDGHWVEVQIRSRRMNDIAERGVAAHWRYKGEQIEEEDLELDKWLGMVREVLEHPSPNGMDFLDTVKLSLYSNDITVFSPKGKSIKLPAKSCVLDFAYAIHSELGDKCIGAKVNYQVVPVSYQLSNGDQVEILDSKVGKPRVEWLQFVRTARAKCKIDAALRRQRKQDLITGEEIVSQTLHSVGKATNRTHIEQLARFYGYSNPDDFFSSVGNGQIDLQEDLNKALALGKENSNIFTRLFSSIRGTTKPKDEEPLQAIVGGQPINKKETYILREEDGKVNYRIASCCHPIPKDEVLGVLDQNQVEVHKRSCPVATRIKSCHGERLLSANWGEHHQTTFYTRIAFRGVDMLGILNTITQILLEDFKVSIYDIQAKSHDGIFEGETAIAVHNQAEVIKICTALKKNKFMLAVYRVAEESQQV